MISLGDPLHSKPLIVNYGGSADNQDIRIIVGTNAGALHMFKDSGATVDESWAFMPREFFPNIDSLRKNYASSDKVYGIDGSATVYVLDTNGNGSIEAVNGDKAWLFIGSRRGGSSYYGLDISYPDNPKLLWHINQNTSGFFLNLANHGLSLRLAILSSISVIAVLSQCYFSVEVMIFRKIPRVLARMTLWAEPYIWWMLNQVI